MSCISRHKLRLYLILYLKFFFTKIQSKIKKKNNDVSLVAVSRFDPIKRIYFLIKIIKNLKSKIPKIQLIIVGDGYQFDRVKRYIKSEKLEKNIKLAGWKKIVQPYHDTSKFYISCSASETISVSLLEAMNRNCIPIVNKVGGNSEVVINNINGYIFKMDDLKKNFFNNL